MAVFLQSRPGVAVRLDDPTEQCLPYYDLPDTEINFDQRRSIVTGIVGDHGVNLQLLHTFGDLVHVYVFGDKASVIQVRGLSFCGCGGVESLHGLAHMYDWYNLHKASSRAAPAKLLIGYRVLEGVLSNFTHAPADAETSMAQWVATFQMIQQGDASFAETNLTG